MQYVIETNWPAIIGLLTLIIMIVFNPVMPRKFNKAFIFAISFTILMLILQAVDYLMAESLWAKAYIIRRITSALGYGLYPLVVVLLINLFSAKRLHWAYYLPAIVLLILCFVSMPTYIVFMINEDNSFAHGPLYFLTLVIPAFYLALLIVKSLISKNYFKQTEDAFVIMLVFSIAISISLELIAGAKFLTWNIISFMLIILYVISINDFYSIDPLTNVLNRLSFQKYLYKNDKKITATIIYFDINNFKELNDKNGHAFGDNILQSVGLELRNTFSKLGYVYRTGGDEFVAVVIKNASEIDDVLKQLDNRLAKINISIAHGVHKINKGDSFSEALDNADAIMYEQKKNKDQNI